MTADITVERELDKATKEIRSASLTAMKNHKDWNDAKDDLKQARNRLDAIVQYLEQDD